MRAIIPLALLSLGLCQPAAAGEAATSDAAAKPAEKKKPCVAPEYRQFDFWLGEWEVIANDKVSGTNTISASLGGCVVHERWQGQGGLNGQSFNLYDQKTGQWRQFWVDNSGSHLDLRGGLVDGKMVLSSVTTQGDKTIHNRITWTPNPDKTVRQVWEVSKDGQTWKAIFDGLYKPKAR